MNLMSKVGLGLITLGICGISLSRPAAAQTIVNAGFDANVDNVLPFVAGVKTITSLGPATNDLPGWNVTNGSVGLVRNSGLLGWQPESGQYSLDLSGLTPGTISQTVDGLVNGQTYKVSFYLAANPLGPVGQDLTASFGDGVARTFSFDGTSTRNNMGWQQFSFNSVYDGANSNLVFAAGSNNGAFGPALDSVSITAVTPEAGGLMNLAGALLAPGLGMIALRRRARKLSDAA